jgi:threonine/homoserine/homoserine lactone efflux protein
MNALIPYMLYTFSSAITPGPNNFMILNSGLHFGVKKSLPHFWGICLGFGLMMFLVALGMGKIFATYTSIRPIFKIIGSIYMLYLAKKIITSDTTNDHQENVDKKPITFFQACLFQWVNPKAWLMGVGVISLFSLTANYFHNALIIGLVYCLVCLPCVGAWLYFGAILQKILKTEKQRRWFNIGMAVCLVASILLIYVD